MNVQMYWGLRTVPLIDEHVVDPSDHVLYPVYNDPVQSYTCKPKPRSCYSCKGPIYAKFAKSVNTCVFK